MKSSLKKHTIILFSLIVLFALVGIVYAATTAFEKYGSLPYNNEISDEAKLGTEFTTYMKDIKNNYDDVNVKTTLKRKVLLVWIESGSTTNIINTGTTNVSNGWTTDERVNTKVIWKNQTSGTTFTATFGAKNE